MPADSEPPLKITADELRRVSVWRPVAPASIFLEDGSGDSGSPGERRMNRLAIAAFVTAVAGIPLFGLVTGLVAIVLGFAALVRNNRRALRGMGFAVAGIALGAFDVVGWTIAIAFLFPFETIAVAVDEFEPEAAALQNLAPPINRAMKANVLIQGRSGWRGLGRQTVGSGVILRIHAGAAYVLTNRHVVDPNFAEDKQPAARAAAVTAAVTVKLLGQPALPANVLWLAPDTVDLAVVKVAVQSAEPLECAWGSDQELKIGDEVFAVGNPHGLGWTHTSGAVSQFRQQTTQGRAVRVIQTNTAINPGNSGGGLYDAAGRLVGIATWTRDKRVAEGLSFAIAFDTFRTLKPEWLNSTGEVHEP